MSLNISYSGGLKSVSPAPFTGDILFAPYPHGPQAFKSKETIGRAAAEALATLETNSLKDLYLPSLSEKVAAKMQDAQVAAWNLEKQVRRVLANGGKIVPIKASKLGKGSGTGGGYYIEDKQGRTVALFKPEDESIWAPQNPNRDKRKSFSSDESIYFHEMNSWEQGKFADRQFLAEMIYVGDATKPPRGGIVELTSDQFVDVAAEGRKKKASVQTKRGYLQEWIPNVKPISEYHPAAVRREGEGLPYETSFFDNLPFLNDDLLDQFQEIGLNDLILYNEDRHTGNILVRENGQAVPTLIPIDHDAIFPWKLKSLVGVYNHENARKPFTDKLLETIQAIDSDLIVSLIEKAGLSEQAAINGKLMIKVIKLFANAGATLYDIAQFVSFGDRSQFDQVSPLWKLVKEAEQKAVQLLSEKERVDYQHDQYLRRTDWCQEINKEWCKKLPEKKQASAALWQKNYASRRAGVKANKRAYFWKEIDEALLKALAERAPHFVTKRSDCDYVYHTSNLCWKKHPLKAGVTHYTYRGPYDNGLPQHFHVLKVPFDSKAKIQVLDARSLPASKNSRHGGRLYLPVLASGVDQSIAAVNGGFFHYTTPKGEYYEWEGEHHDGDPVGKLVVNGKLKSENPKEPLWGVFQISASGETSIVDTSKNSEKSAFALGGVPLLIKNDLQVTKSMLGDPISLKPKQAAAPGIQFRSHMDISHARTGVCETKKKDRLFIVVEGKQQNAKGLRIVEFARLLKTLGCLNALNLDGGGTADLIVKDAEGNFVSEIISADPKGKRPIANAIVISAPSEAE